MSRVMSNFLRTGAIWMWLAQAVSAEMGSILQGKATGSVHSVFNQSFNIQFGDRLVHIGALDSGLAPFGIGLDYADTQLLTRKVNIRQSVAWNNRKSELIFSSGEILSLQHATVDDLLLSCNPYDRVTLQKNFEEIIGQLFDEKWQTGIVQTEKDKQHILYYLRSTEPSIHDSPIVKEFANLQALVQGEKTAAVPLFNYWIGRGAGLTPSGDDILTGLTAMLSVLGTSVPFVEHLASYLHQYGSQRTTQVGLEYLLYATVHQFHSHLVHLCKNVLQPNRQQVLTALEEMRKMGHTSGTDTLLGLLLGMKIQLSSVYDRNDNKE